MKFDLLVCFNLLAVNQTDKAFVTEYQLLLEPYYFLLA